jgi:hypothetical protein
MMDFCRCRESVVKPSWSVRTAKVFDRVVSEWSVGVCKYSELCERERRVSCQSPINNSDGYRRIICCDEEEYVVAKKNML